MKWLDKKILLIVGIVAVILIVISIVLAFVFKEGVFLKQDTQGIKISQYDYTAENPLIKEVEITNKKDADYLRKIYDNAKSEEIEEAILAEVIIDFNNDNKLYFGFSNENYAYILDETTREGRMISMPDGLLEFATEKLK